MERKLTFEDLKFMAKEGSHRWLMGGLDKSWVTPELIEKELDNIDECYKERILIAAGVRRKDYVILNIPSTKGGYISQKDANIRTAIYEALRHLVCRIDKHEPVTPTKYGLISCPHCRKDVLINLGQQIVSVTEL